jgi:hypothetical protein
MADRKTSWGAAAGLSMVLVAGAGWAQEPAERDATVSQSEEDAVRAEPRLRIRVLDDPYDLASFYRSGGRGAGSPFDFSDRYPIASFYRADGAVHPQGYSRFWTSGYSARGAFGMRYRRRIGENGDIFLMAPTFLAPLGPLTVAFVDE